MPFTDNSDFLAQQLPSWLQALNAGQLQQLGASQLPEQYSRGQPPAWFANAAAAQVTQLLARQAERKALSQRLGKALGGFRGIAAFATPLLEEALLKRFGLKLDVHRNDFIEIVEESVLLGSLRRRRPEKRSLLLAALHNFSAGQVFGPHSALAPAGAFSIELVAGKTPASVPGFTFRFSEKLAIAPGDFAALCRTLDLGAQYQRHLTHCFVSSPEAGEVPGLLQRCLALELETAGLVAAMKNDLSADGLAMVQALAAGKLARLQGRGVQAVHVSMLGSPINDLLIIGAPRAGSDRVEPCVVWMIGDAVAPLKQYASTAQFITELKQRLQDTQYLRAFCQRVPRVERAHFQRTLAGKLEKKHWNGSYYVISADLRPNLEVLETLVSGPLLKHLVAQHLAALRSGAAALAMPTAAVDAQDLINRWVGYAETLQGLLNDAALFIPALAPIMSVVMAQQLMSEFFTGVEAWEEGLRAQAFSHLQGVILNVAAVLVVGAAGAKLAPAALVEDMRLGELPDGSRRLFAWRQPGETPLQWDAPQLLSRLGPLAEGMSETRLEQALSASGVRAADLRLMYHDGRPLPAMLADTLERFQALGEARASAATPQTQALRRDFPGLPQRLALELAVSATDVERARMLAGVLPLRLAEEARAALQQVRVTRAIEGLYVPQLANTDTALLLQRLATRLPPGEMLSRSAIAALAAADRRLVQEALGLAPIRPGFKAPLREGREIGYRLSGKGAGQAPEDRIRRLYPAMDQQQVTAMRTELEAKGPSLHAALAVQEAQWEELGEALDGWSRDAATPYGANGRRQVGELIKSAWRRQGATARASDGSPLGTVLQLAGMDLRDFPPLACELESVGVLSLRQCALEQAPESLLRACPRLRHLDMSANRLTTLPQSVTQLPHLTRLQLSTNRIVLSQPGAAALARMTTLRALMLDGNPLGRALDVSQMEGLRVLHLRATAADGWPTGFERLNKLEGIDLRQNRIIEIPRAVLEPAAEQAANVDRINRNTPLHGNPLSDASRERLATYYEEHSIHPSMLPGRVIEPLDAGDAQAGRWLQGAGESERATHMAAWRTLQAQPGQLDFFELIRRMSTSHDFQHAYPSLRTRVWALINAAVENTALREELFELAANPLHCGDGAALVFSRLVVREMVFAASHTGGPAEVQSGLLKLAMGLFRIDEVERIATLDIASRPARGLDEVEVRLAYLQGLAERLDLPGQPKGMIFRRISGVTAAKLDAAALQVAGLEGSEVMIQSLAGREFWVQSLEQKGFAEIDRRYQLRAEVLFSDKEHLSGAHYLARYDNLMKQRSTERHQLAVSLTREILARQPQVTEL
jgi:hypothetical protein